MTQFLNPNGSPLENGKVYFYVPGTTTPATTWMDPYQTTANSNPILLDGSGRALIFGSGLYRQVVQDTYGNVIWDQLTLSAAVPPGTGTGIYVFQNSPTIISPSLTGTPVAPTQTLGDASQAVATDAFVAAAIAAIVPPVNAVPSGAVMGFNLQGCPAGWISANGTANTVDMRGTVPRAIDNGRGLDTSGTGIGGYEYDMFQTHTMSAPSGTSFVVTPGGTLFGAGSPIATWGTSGSTGGPNSGQYGYETRVKSTVLLFCQKS
jgi:hypothetical protein